jgi:hypothetical protein
MRGIRRAKQITVNYFFKQQFFITKLIAKNLNSILAFSGFKIAV